MKRINVSFILVFINFSIVFAGQKPDTIERVSLFPEQYRGKILYFDLVVFRGVEKDRGVIGLGLNTPSGKYISPILKSDGITFVVSNRFGSVLVDTPRDTTIRIGCRIIEQTGNAYRPYWVARVFEIAFYKTDAVIGRYLDVFKVISDDPIASLHHSAEIGDSHAIEALVKDSKSLPLGIDLNVRDQDGRTALIIAASNGHSKTIKTLLDFGADVTLRTKDNKTALIVATEKGHKEIIKILRKAGAKD